MNLGSLESLFFWPLDTSINSLIIYKKEYNNNVISHKDFRLEICNSLNTRNIEDKKVEGKKILCNK
jgi:hypothetical protein